MQIIAHRGVSAHVYENTLNSFNEALKLDIHGIELDVHQVEDDFVIFHDFTIEKISGIAKEIAHMSMAEIKQIRLKDDQYIPCLSEVLTLVNGKMPLNIEIKAIQNVELFVNHLVKYVYDTNGTVILSSFNHLLVRELQSKIRQTRIGNNIKFGALIAHLPLDMAQFATTIEADIAGIDAFLVNEKFVEHAHNNNKEVWCYTVNSVLHAKLLHAIGVDAIFTNDPGLMLKEL